MIGREAYQRPWMLSHVDSALFGDDSRDSLDRKQVVEQLLMYMERQIGNGAQFWHIARHVLGLYHGEPGGKQFRRLLSEKGPRPGASPALLREAATLVEQAMQRQHEWNAGRPGYSA